MAHEVNPVKKDLKAAHGLSTDTSANQPSDPGTSTQDSVDIAAVPTELTSDQNTEALQQELVTRVGPDRVELWIPATTVWSCDADGLTLEFESEFGCQLANKMLGRELAEQLSLTLGRSAKLHMKTKSGAAKNSDAKNSAAKISELQNAVSVKGNEHSAIQAASTAKANTSVASTSTVRAVSDSTPAGEASSAPSAPASRLKSIPAKPERDSWKQFVAGECNQLAWATAKLVVSDPGKMTPVLFHGPSGVGKSLLAKAIAEQLRTVRRLPRVIHMSSEQFLNEFTDGLRGGGLPMFRRKYRDVEALILEDIQFFVGKKSSLAEVKHTLDNLLRLGKQVIFVADRSLNELQGLGNDLVARIRGGLTTPVFPLDEATRKTILQRDLQANGLQIAEDVIDQIARQVTGDGRVLSGIVKRLAATAAVETASQNFDRSPSAQLSIFDGDQDNVDTQPSSENTIAPNASSLDWDRCWSAIADLVQATKPIVRIVDIDRAVCNMFGLEPESLQSESKIRRVSQPRMLAMFLARKYTPAAYKEIGQYFGRRRHSTVISAEKTVESWLHENSDLDVGPGLKVRDAIRHVESQLQVG